MSKQYYFFVYYPTYEKEEEDDTDFIEPKERENKPECIYSLEEIENSIFYYRAVKGSKDRRS